jgi:hypothetical protein
MSIGPDIKEVLTEVGIKIVPISVLSGELTAEYIDIEPNSQVTKPFIREFFVEGTFPHDTAVIAGDIVRFDVTSQEFLVMNRTPAMFENQIIEYGAVLYKSNVSGSLWRSSGETRDAETYQQRQNWVEVHGVCYGLLTEKLFGMGLEQDEELGQLGVQAEVIYIPSAYNAKVLDRYVVTSGENAEYYKIEIVEARKFDNVDVCHVVEDTRQFP